jgi:PAS domain S-box-containing protein
MSGAGDQPWVISSTTDPAGRCTHLDGQWTALTGQSVAAALGAGWLDMLQPDDRPKTIETLRSALGRRSPFRHEFRLRRKDGAFRWALAVGAPRFDESGAFLGYAGSIIDIHARRATGEALRESEERLRLAHERLTATLRASPVVVFEQDLDLRYAWIQNPALGFHPSEVVGKTDHELFGREDADALVAIKRRVIETGTPAREEVRIFIDGAQQFYYLSVDPRTSGGEILGVLCTATDITERKQAEEALRRTRESLAIAVEAGQMGTWDIDLIRGQTVHRNLRHDQIFGYDTLQEAWGSDIARRHVLEEDLPTYEAAIARAQETGDLRFEVRLRWPDGSHHWMAARGRLAFDENGKPTQASGVNFDITEQKRAEETLRESEARLKLALEAANAGDWEWAPETHEFNASGRAKTLHGLNAELPMTHEMALAAVHPEDRPRVETALRDTLESGAPFHIEIRAPQANGSMRWLTSRAELRPEGGRKRLIGLVQDITERKRVEEALKEADRRKDEFLATLGHELRNPLASIQNVAEILRKTERADASASDRTLIEMMQRQVRHLVRLVDDLLEISRINSDKIELRKARTSLAAILKDALEISLPQIEKKGHRLETRLASEPLTLSADPVRLAQVLTNIINNAVRYTAPGGRITIETRQRDEEAVIKVEDDGVGIQPEMLPRVFDLFSQVGGAERSADGGLGVGLALAKKLVELHGGVIEAQSAGLGCGSAFVVRLPLDGSPAPFAGSEPAKPTAKGQPVRLLVIDDDHDVADSLGMLMESFDAEVRVAYDGISGVDIAAEFQPAIAMIDIRMPMTDGYETARLMRERLGDSAPMIVALTGLGQDKDRERALDAGFDMHLTKPVAAERLEDLLRRRTEWRGGEAGPRSVEG